MKDKHVLRSIIQTANAAIARAYDTPDEVNELLDTVEASVLGIREGSETNKAPTVKQSVIEVIEQFEAMLSGDRGQQGITTGYEMLDKMCSGLKPGKCSSSPLVLRWERPRS